MPADPPDKDDKKVSRHWAPRGGQPRAASSTGQTPVLGFQVSPDYSRNALNAQLLNAVQSGDEDHVSRLLDLADVNYQEPGTQASALHYAAAYRAYGCLRVLIDSGKCDYHIRDGRNLYPSEVAFEFGHDPEMGAELAALEAAQARERGLIIWPKPPPGKPLRRADDA